MQDFIFSVAEVLGRPGAVRDVSVRSTLAGVQTPLVRLSSVEPVTGELRAEGVMEGVLVTGRVQGVAEARCARCLEALATVVGVDVCELFAAVGRGPGFEDVYRVRGTEIDLEQLVRDALVLALPLNPLCRGECRGLCARCGRNLNEDPCECVEEDKDPRWAALDEVRARLEVGQEV